MKQTKEAGLLEPAAVRCTELVSTTNQEMKKLCVVLIILWLGKGSAQYECGSCKCCKNGSSRCSYWYNYCLDGCNDGYYGNKCLHACFSYCLNCSSKYICLNCIDGFYIGRYLDDNFYNYYDDCRNKCKPNCQSCSSYETCNVCREGFYNGKQYTDSLDTYEDCRHQCRDNCKSCTSYNVCTECKDGYYNGLLNRDCSLQCNNVCKSCNSSNQCTECKVGHFLNSLGSCKSCNPNCSFCLNYDTCTSCITGKYNNLHKDCRESCRPECKTCNSNNDCSECISGRFGTSCEKTCGHGCVDNTCEKNSGYCTCKTGFSPFHCNTCVYNKNGTNCDKCIKGKYGEWCDTNCPDGCENNNCSLDGKCYSCKVGKYGENCTRSCSTGCAYDNCTYNGECYSCKNGFIGKKCDKCIGSKYGNKCDKNCSSTCLACDSLTNCSACIDRHWGNTCQSCPKNCLKCLSENTCSLCETGFYGLTCSEICNTNCYNNQCDQVTGSCSKRCVVGHYGENCELKCSINCAKSVCDRVNGECIHGCKAGYNGTTCTQSLESLEEDNGTMGVVSGVSVGGGLFVLIAIIAFLVVLLYKKRRRGNKQDDHNKRIKTEDDNMTYSEINENNMIAEHSHTDGNETDRENSVINNTDLSTKGQETDSIYAKPIKPKRKTETVKSLNRNSTEVTVNNPTYEKPDTSQTETVEKAKNSKPPIASKPAQKYDNNVIPKPSAMQPTSHISHIQNDAALEIEEDIDCLSSRSKSVFLEEQKAAELDNADTYYNVAAVIKRKITLDKLPDCVAKKTKKDFIDEFQSLPAMLIKPYVDSQKRENRSKNRYKGIYPYDDTRVVLKEGDSDYINASYIDGYNKNKAYIASIGPTYKYMGDMSAFWIMVWQENVGKIVMLTNLEEGGVPKCDLYWPEKDFSLMFANIQVTCHTEENYADYTFRSFSVQKDSIKREIVQVHFTAWPDKGTPDDVTSLIEFRQKVNSTKTKLDGPILVHCSAGIGRTGTYIALDSITNEGEAEGAVDIYAFVRNMREQRVNMIQTAEQYQYLHNAIIHTLTFDSKAVEASVFNDYMKTHTEVYLGNMFEKLQASVEQRSDDEQEAVKRNKTLVNKNRNVADIPGDSNRPLLFRAKTPGQSDYINAVYVNSFKNVNRFLIAQTPLSDTVEDFLKLIVQEKVSCVISMETTSSENKDVGIYCPADNQTLRKGAFTIKTERGDGTDQYQLKKMKISYKSKSGSEEIIVPHVQYTQWDNNKSIPGEPVKFVQFVKDMELKFSGTDTNRPMLVHCLTGAKKGGLFCVVSTLLEKTQIDQEVSVANTVRQIKYRRHLAVPDKDQYIFCHHCVNEYLRTFDIYSNFELKT